MLLMLLMLPFFDFRAIIAAACRYAAATLRVVTRSVYTDIAAKMPCCYA